MKSQHRPNLESRTPTRNPLAANLAALAPDGQLEIGIDRRSLVVDLSENIFEQIFQFAAKESP